MPNPNALQVRLDDEVVIEGTVAYPMEAHICTIVQPNADGEAQVYLSSAPFEFRLIRSSRNESGDRVHRVFARPLTVFSHPLNGLDSVTLETFLIRDRRRARGIAAVLEDLVGSGGVSDDLADGLEAVTEGTVGAAFAVVGGLGRLFARILRGLDNRLIIHDIGTQPVPSLPEVGRDEAWGRGTGDKGYFSVRFDKVSLARPEQTSRPPRLPPKVERLLEAYLGHSGAGD